MVKAEVLKSEIRITELLTRLNLQPNRAGFIHCPAHVDKTASLKIYIKTDSWSCFSCRRGGTVIDLYMHFMQVDFKTANQELAQMFGISTEPLSRRRQAEIARNKFTHVKARQKQEEYEMAYQWWLTLKQILEEDHTEFTPELIVACKFISQAEYELEILEEEMANE